MRIAVSDELKNILSSVQEEQRSDEEWSLIESDDMFQSTHFCGGFDATEQAFCFSYFDKDNSEYWFQITSREVHDIVENRVTELEVRPAPKS